MATLSTSAINWLADEWEKVFDSAVLSGIVGDLAHKARGGYHISRQDQGGSNYSVVRSDDKSGPSDRAAAIDMTMNTSDIKKCHTRLRAVFNNRSNDPRIKYINAWNGWDGQGDAGRYDVVTGNVATATADHKWHIHLEIRRRYVNDMNAMKAILSMVKGESLDSYLGEPAKPQPVEDDEMTQTEFTNFLLNAINNPEVAAQLRARPWQYVGGGLNGAASSLTALSSIYTSVNALTTAVAGIAEKVDLDPAEIDALKAALAVPTAEQNADATVAALGTLSADELADVLVGVLGADKAAALKNAL